MELVVRLQQPSVGGGGKDDARRRADGVAHDLSALLQVVADVLQTQVIPVIMKRVILRGTALITLDVLAPGVDRAEPVVGDMRWPIKNRVPYYSARKQQFQDLYDAVVATLTDR
jgi:gluconokinase